MRAKFFIGNNKANLRDLIAATGLVILLKLDSNHGFFSPYDFEVWWMTLKIIGHIFYTTSSFVHHFKAIGELKLELRSGNAQFGSKSAIFFVPYDLEIWWMTLKNNRAPHLCYFKALCVVLKPSVNSNWSYSPETLNSSENRRVFVLCDLEIWQMTLKTIEHLFWATSSFMHHFIIICEFKLELQSGNG